MATSQFIKQLTLAAGSKRMAAQYLMDQLVISKDGAYRRLRGSTTFTPDEIFKIASDWNISLDRILEISQSTESVYFEYAPYQLVDNKYLEFFRELFFQIPSYEKAQLIYSCKLLPYIYSLYYPTLLAFNGFFFSRLLHGDKNTVIKPFSENRSSPLQIQLEEMKQRALAFTPLFFQIPSTEIWHPGTVAEYLTRIRYCWESGLIESETTKHRLLDDLSALLHHLHLQAKKGYKQAPNQSNSALGKYHLYFTDAIGLEYQVLRQIGTEKKVFLINNTGDFLASTDKKFTDRTEKHLANLIQTATLISEINEKKRNSIFSKFQQQIEQLR